MFKTKRLEIRRFKPEDANDLYDYLSDPEVVKYEPYDVISKEKALKMAIDRSQDEAFYAVCLNGKVIGNLYFESMDYNTYMLGYVFNRAYSGKGYATESAEGLIKYAFEKLNARRIIARCSSENSSSWKLLERLKMRREGYFLKKVYFKKDENNQPIWLDVYQYAILKEEWESKTR